MSTTLQRGIKTSRQGAATASVAQASRAAGRKTMRKEYSYG